MVVSNLGGEQVAWDRGAHGERRKGYFGDGVYAQEEGCREERRYIGTVARYRDDGSLGRPQGFAKARLGAVHETSTPTSHFSLLDWRDKSGSINTPGL